MEASDWQEVRALFEAALARPEGERRAFLEAAAEGPIRDEVADARRAVAHRERYFPGESARTAYGRAVLGATLLARGDAAAALALLEPAHERLVGFAGPDARNARTTRAWLEQARTAAARVSTTTGAATP